MRFLVLSLCFLMGNAWASDFFIVPYKVEKGDTFGKTLRKFVKDSSLLNAQSPTIIETRKRNPKIATKEGWNNLAVGDTVELLIEKKIVDRQKLKDYLDKKRGWYSLYPAEYATRSNDYQSLRGSIFYGVATGASQQSSSLYPSVNFQQTSLFGLGGSLTYFPKHSLWSYSFYGSASKLQTTGTNINSESVSVPTELSFSVNAGYYFRQLDTRVYAGIDYDTFSTFNLAGIENENKIFIDENKMYSLTLGVAKNLKLFERPFYSRLSVSRSLSSSHTSDYVGLTGGDLSGYKLLLYTNFRMSSDFYIFTSFMYNVMDSADYDLNTYRINLGLGYIIF